MSKKLEGKIALITGGSRGIGAAIAKRLAADGAKVAITYTKGADAATAVVKAIERAGGKAIAIQADATDADAVKAAVEKTVATLQGGQGIAPGLVFSVLEIFLIYAYRRHFRAFVTANALPAWSERWVGNETSIGNHGTKSNPAE